MSLLFKLFTLGAGAVARKYASQQLSGPRCDDCGCSVAGGGIRMDTCCGRSFCYGCLDDYLTKLGGGRFVVRCKCGEVTRGNVG